MGLSQTRQGLAIFFTGLSAAGKSTTAKILLDKLSRRSDRRVTLLDGDLVRKRLFPTLGYSKEDRDLHIRRIGWMASEITKDGGIAICAAIAPYDRTRKEVRALVQEAGGAFVLIHVATPLAVCEQRDPKGLYAKARAGALEHFTGISDPYEVPREADLVIDTTSATPEKVARQITDHLECEGFLCPSLLVVGGRMN